MVGSRLLISFPSFLRVSYGETSIRQNIGYTPLKLGACLVMDYLIRSNSNYGNTTVLHFHFAVFLDLIGGEVMFLRKFFSAVK